MKRQRKGPNKEGPTLPRSLVAAAGEDDVRHHDARVFSATRRALSKKQLRRKLKADTKKQNVMRAERLAREARKRRKQNEATEPQHESSSGTEASEASEASDVADAAAAVIEAPVSAPGVDMPVAVAEPTRAAYVPPQLRRSQLAGSPLMRSLRSLLNKMAASTVVHTADQVAELAEREPRSEVIRELTALIVGDVAADAATIVAGKVVAVFAALVAVLYHRHAFGTPLASALSEALLVRFEQVYAAGQSKSCVGAVTALGYLFVFDVVGPALLAGLCTRLVTSFTALDVELLLAAMQLAGMKLRTDAPGDLLELLAALQLAVKQHRAQQDVAFDQRTAFMMETLTAIKNNRYMHEDPHVAPLRKAMELTHSALQQPLRISWADLAHGCATGDRWWLRAGGAAPRSSAAGTSASSSSALDAAPEGDALLSALARKLRMNSDVRRRVFFVLMSAEGFADASEKIFKLQLKGKSERDVVYVIMESCAHEKRYNPFYGYVAARLCENSKNFRLTFLYGFWDRLRTMGSVKPHASVNLALLLRQLVSQALLDLTVFKPVDFLATFEPGTLNFLNAFFAHLIADVNLCSNDQLRAPFLKLATRCKSDEMQLLRDGLLLFLRFNLTFRKDLVNETNRSVVNNRFAMVKQALQHQPEDDIGPRGSDDDDDLDVDHERFSRRK